MTEEELMKAAAENILYNHRTSDRTLSGKALAEFGQICFCQGAQWRDEQSPWISVADKMPPYDKDKEISDTPYLVRCVEEHPAYTIERYTVSFMTHHGRFTAESHPMMIRVTHWMPIPKLNDKTE